MLIEFKVANFRSVRDEQTLSFVASNYSAELPNNLISCEKIPGLQGTNLVIALALYGANASGKSNVVTALRFLAEFVRDSATRIQPGQPTGTQPFKLDKKCVTSPSKFEVSAVIDGIRMLYGLELTRDRIISEYLVAYPKARPQVWFEREWDAANSRYKWSKPSEHFKQDTALRKKTRENAAFLSLAAQFNSDKAKQVYTWFSKHLRFLGSSPTFAIDSAARRILAHPKYEVLSALLKRADIGVEAVKHKSLADSDRASELLRAATLPGAPGKELKWAWNALITGKLSSDLKKMLEEALEGLPPIPELHHRGVNGELVPLDFFGEESTGTQRYLEIVTELAVGTTHSRLLIADEVEFSLHPLLLRDIMKFCSVVNATHPNIGSQFLFTSHNPLLLDQTLLRRDQIWFTEKDKDGATRLYPLTEFKPRKEESLIKGYLAGRYGGIPFIPESLTL